MSEWKLMERKDLVGGKHVARFWMRETDRDMKWLPLGNVPNFFGQIERAVECRPSRNAAFDSEDHPVEVCPHAPDMPRSALEFYEEVSK